MSRPTKTRCMSHVTPERAAIETETPTDIVLITTVSSPHHLPMRRGLHFTVGICWVCRCMLLASQRDAMFAWVRKQEALMPRTDRYLRTSLFMVRGIKASCFL